MTNYDMPCAFHEDKAYIITIIIFIPEFNDTRVCLAYHALYVYVLYIHTYTVCNASAVWLRLRAGFWLISSGRPYYYWHHRGRVPRQQPSRGPRENRCYMQTCREHVMSLNKSSKCTNCIIINKYIITICECKLWEYFWK